jgi:hypothetical protein
VQFGADTDSGLEHVSGRLEHLQTGRRSRFASVDELLARMRAILAGEARPTDEETSTPGEPGAPPSG